ncbi:helix-turn-helix domain-containing protein [Streptomyces sp. NBC_00015]|uniref:helix-turn-helix domain-containing protein n=1 Tax=unclassified Streptomyces TaxID=2593676 RepID=UPI0022561120|nr:helix-turn-helix transcriptional regulator [Streptomyces sp. NBC_00103]MCX5369068.1 helix-turn-helix domain-containing protein [Streptomyces sp. NBC_00103]
MSVPEDQQDPIYQGHRLRKRLRAARESAGLTHIDVAEALEWSPSKINRIETGKVGLTITDARVLLELYGITDSGQVREITDMARAARRPPWWAAYRSIAAAEFLRYLSYESSAIRIRNFESNLIPGLLQTEEYAKEVFGMPGGTVNVEALLELRLERQDRIVRANGPELFFVLDEAAIRRIVGSAQIMKNQYEKLLTLNEMENVTIKVAPFTAGLYRQFRSPYVLFQFPEEDEDLVAYLEKPDGQVLLSERSPFTGMDAKDPSDYLDDFWFVEKQVALDLTEEFLMRGLQ